MLLIIALLLFVVWIVGFAFFRAMVGGAIHVILLIAIIALIWHFASRHSSASPSGRASVAAGGAPPAVASVKDF